MKKRFNDTLVTHYLALYKARPSSDGLELLYNTLDPIINEAVSGIARQFRRSNPNEYEDLLQEVKIGVFNYLKTIAEISNDGEHLVSILLKVCVWVFKASYARWKRITPIDIPVLTNTAWSPDNENIPYFISTDFSEASKYAQKESSSDSKLASSSQLDTLTKHGKLSLNASQYENALLQELPDIIINNALSLNRYKDKEALLRFCIACLMVHRLPSVSLIDKQWKESNAEFWVQYSLVLLKASFLRFVSEPSRPTESPF